MTLLDWLIVVGANGAIVGYGLLLSRRTRRSSDWLLAAKSLPWWMVGLSMFATAVDSGDYVAVVGGAYTFGLSNLATWWLGLPIGWLVAAYFVFLPLYRGGMFTNAEYLEYRFGPAARFLSAFIQIQNRTNVLGNIAFSLYLTFSILTHWGSSAWWLVAAIAMASALYTATGGLRSVAATDALQSIVMLMASVLLWWVLWSAVGGWTGLESRFQQIDPQLVDTMMHIGRDEPGVPAPLIIFGWVIVLTAYCLVNHSQSMRLLAARSEWDLKTAALTASVVTVGVMWFNITLGILGRAVMPELAAPDRIYPLLVQEYLTPGLVGLVVAGVLAGGISTYDSIGSSLAAVFTRDVYARFLVKGRKDVHYLRVSRWATPVIIAASFLYIPFLQEGMVRFYLRITSVTVMPLFTMYLMGTLTPVHRRAGLAGLLAGIGYGLSSLLGEALDWPLPLWWTNTWWAYLWSPLVSAGTMLGLSWRWGWMSDRELQGLTFRFGEGDPSDRRSRTPQPLAATRGTWLEESRQELSSAPKYPFDVPPGGLPWYGQPSTWNGLFLALVAYLALVVLW